ncbi:transcription initiation factor IIA subunit 1-like isoform X2 [Babylonia areolata]|uniref:transcription initiation factor IIA subunit 1-like isoform X2 n=1 Tax=Babylonia areolata TaxID=304850 RepID=UPI003FD4A44A
MIWEKKLAATKALEHTCEPELHLCDHAGRRLLREQGCNTVQLQQGYVPETTSQQPEQIFPVALTTNQAELVQTGVAGRTTLTLPVGILPQQLAALAQGNVTLQATASGHVIAVQTVGVQPGAITLPQRTFITQGPTQTQHGAGVTQVTATPLQKSSGVLQVDGAGDGSSSSEDDDFDNDVDDQEEEQNEEETEQGEEEEPLNSADDESEEESTDLFDSENVIVCQYDKINRNKNKWKFNLKDGIMNLNGKDFVFHRSHGDAEW